MRKVLGPSFFARPAPVVARELLGKFLVRRVRGRELAGMITETEAYEGLDDLASHASRGRTPRTEVMFGESGRWYVYLIYGMYSMLNIVTGPNGHPSAVLIRGTDMVSGPGRLTRALAVTKTENANRATKETGLWIEDRGTRVPSRRIRNTPRIGVAYAGEHWAAKPWRFVYDPDDVS